MNISVPVPALIAQWVALLALCVLVIILYRQLAVLLTVRDRSHLDLPSLVGLTRGSRLPAVKGELVVGAGAPRAFAREASSQRPTLLLFADPLCGSCEMAVEALNRASESGLLQSVDALVVTSENPAYVEAIDAFRLSAVPVVHMDKSRMQDEFKVLVTPLFCVADNDGTVVAVGPGHDDHAVRKFLHELETEHRHGGDHGHRHATVGIASDSHGAISGGE
jgi:hypothetical protein